MLRKNGKRSSHRRKSIARFPASEELERRQLLSATLSLGQSMLVFNAVENSSVSQTETLTLTDSGDAALTLGSSALTIANDPSNPTQDAARFSILNSSSVPASLSPGQSFSLQLDYNAIAHVINSAFLDISTNDPVNPVQQVALRGIGALGIGGSNQPSLAMILMAYEIPTLVGEGPNDADYLTDGTYPNPPDASSQEVVLQRLVAANPSEPVTIQVLASFDAAATKPYTLGYYTPGNPAAADRNQLFFTPTSEYQSTYIQPQGATSFDPGSADFGFYFVSNIKDSGVNRIGYSEDSLNTWDTTNDRKFRFFPMETPDGTVVPNEYIMTSTEWNAPVGYDFTNIVAIVSNVTAAAGAPTGPVMGLQNPQALPGSDTLMFSRIQNQNVTIGDTVHDTDVLEIENTGASNLVVNSATLSSSAWEFVSPPTYPLTIAAGGNYDLTIKFIATTEPAHSYNETDGTEYPNDGGVYSGTITLNGNDPVNPTQTLPLEGWWQYKSENINEPSVQSLINLMAGYDTDINPTPIPTLTESTATGAAPTYYGEEVVSAYWAIADATQPMNIVQLDSYHTQGATAALYWYAEGSSSTHTIFTTASDYGQTIFPALNGTTTPATASLTPSSTDFGFKVDAVWSDDTKNTASDVSQPHAMRFYPLRDGAGNLVPNTYILCMDYPDGTVTNFDFNDNIYIISNIHPVKSNTVTTPQTTAAPPAPTDFYATAGPSGVTLQWAPITDSTLVGYNVYSSLAPTSGFALLNSTPTTSISFLDTTAPSGTQIFYRVTAVDSVGESLGVESSATTLGTPTSGLQSIDIGATPSGATTVVTPGSAYTVVAGGPGVTGTTDGFRFVFQAETGNFDVSVQVDSLTVAGNYSTAGIMARTTLNTDSPDVYMSASPVNYRFKYRTTTGGSTSIATAGSTSYPNVWVRLTRIGNVFTGYYSTDGQNWTEMSSITLALPSTLYIGLAVASNDSTQTTTAQLTNFAAAVAGPVANADTFDVVEGQPIQVNVLANDTDATGVIQPTTVTIDTPPNEGGSASVNPTTGEITYTSQINFVGVETFSYTVEDSQGLTSAPATVTMLVAAGTVGPTAASYNVIATAGQPLNIDVLSDDTDETGAIVPASVTVSSGPAAGNTVSVNSTTGEITYTAANNFSGLDTFTYTVTDDNGNISPAGTVTIDVNATVALPIANADSANAITGVPLQINELANDTDATGTIDPTTVSIIDPPSQGGTAVPDPTTGIITYTSAAGFAGTETFTYTVGDSNHETSAPATVTVTVSNPAVAPVAANDSGSTQVGDAVEIDVLSNDTSTVGLNPASVQIAAQAAHGQAAANSAGVITYTPASGFVGTDSFTYTVADENGSTSNAARVDISVGTSIASTAGSNRSLTFTDADGGAAIITLNRGSAQIFFSGDGSETVASGGRITISGADLQVTGITLAGTTVATVLTIAPKNHVANVNLGGITDAGVLGTISAPSSVLTGTINVAGLASLRLAQASGGQIQIGAGGAHNVGITVAAATNTSIDSSIPIRALRAGSWTTSALGSSVITAPALGSVSTTGDLDAKITLTGGGTAAILGSAHVGGQLGTGVWSVSGNVGSITAATVSSSWTGQISGRLASMAVRAGGLSNSLTAGSIGSLTIAQNLSGAALVAGTANSIVVHGSMTSSAITLNDPAAAKVALNQLLVSGAISDTAISSAGGIGSISAASLGDSTIEAGTQGTVTLANATTGNLGGMTIGSIHLGHGATAFSDSTILAQRIISASLGIVSTAATGQPNGLGAQVLDSVSLIVDGKTVHLGHNQLASPTALQAYLQSKSVSFGDSFEIELVS